MIPQMSYKMLFLLVWNAWPLYGIANLVPMNPGTQPKAFSGWYGLWILFIYNTCTVNFCSSNLWLGGLGALADHLLMIWYCTVPSLDPFYECHKDLQFSFPVDILELLPWALNLFISEWFLFNSILTILFHFWTLAFENQP